MGRPVLAIRDDSDQEPLWALYEMERAIWYHGLNIGEVTLFYIGLSYDDRKKWLVWCEGWTEWEALAHAVIIENLAKTVSDREAQYRTSIPELPTFSKKSEQRRSPRSQVQLEVEILCNGQSFRSHSVDISAGGVRLFDPVPEWVAGYFTVILTHPDGTQLELIGTIVEDQSVYDKTRLEFRPSEKMILLGQWISKNK